MRKRIEYKAGERLHEESLLVFVRDVASGIDRKALFLCDCGKEVETYVSHIKTGSSKSCGCLQVKSVTTHGLTRNTEYNTWTGMNQRCHNERDKDFKNYGGRGIVVCDEWRNSFENFLYDMGEKPSAGHSIERMDNDAGYLKSNCIWATKSAQARNHRTHKNNKSGQTGVSWNKSHSEWRVYIMANNNNIYLGGFNNKEDAIAARKAGELEHWS